MSNIHVNEVIIDSIPIDKHLKRWLLSRYRKLCRCNGPVYAAGVFAKLRQVVLEYRADPNRLEKVIWYRDRMPFRHKGHCSELLMYADCSPLMTLNLLKLYIGMNDPLVTVHQSATTQHRYLCSRTNEISTQVPGFLRLFLEAMDPHLALDRSIYEIYRKRPIGQGAIGLLQRACRAHSYETVAAYRRKWGRILYRIPMITDQESKDLIEHRSPTPEAYKDYQSLEDQSVNLDTDYWCLCAWLDTENLLGMDDRQGIVPPRRSIEFLRSYVNQHPLAHSLLSEEPDGRKFAWLPSNIPKAFFLKDCVGEIHHIPKKGTIKRRPIAVPNRFLQMGMLPMQQQLEKLLRSLPQDCTFNQDKFDNKVTNRVTNPALYVASVDLSQATDNLPLSWGRFIWDHLFSGHVCDTVKRSYHLFLDCCQSYWYNDGYYSLWTVGQPLGTLPSFDLLGITHNLLLEGLSFSLGLLHSPYAILGDDLLVFNKKLRKHYIRFMNSVGMPLSLQKSYEGNLVEFAGKTFIRNQVPAYTSDQYAITWNSLFDYQRSTGVRIPWTRLPRYLKRKVEKTLVTAGLPVDDSRPSYELAQLCLLHPRGSLDHLTNHKTIDRVAAWFVEIDKDPDPYPDPYQSSGIVLIAGRPVTYGDYGYSNKDGHLLRYRKVQLPQWFKDKVRPCATDKAILAAARVISG